jgi:Fe-S-cluster containining protein
LKPDSTARKRRPIPGPCLDEVEEIYARLDAELAERGYACRACGSCCDLVGNGFRLYLSSLELGLILDREGLDHLPPGQGGGCGFLDGALCRIHGRRPLGCRTFFCGAEPGPLSELHERYLKALKRLAERYGVEWDYFQRYPK